MTERTLLMLKPDAVQRGLMGQIIERIERKGFRIIAMRMCQLDREDAERHYAEHKGAPYFEDLISFIIRGPVVPMCVEGPRVIAVTRHMIGATYGHEAEPGTIRGDFGGGSGYNLIHGSDSVESAEAELALYFTSLPDQQTRPLDSWVWHPKDENA